MFLRGDCDNGGVGNIGNSTCCFPSVGDIEGEICSLRLELILVITCECGIEDDMVAIASSRQEYRVAPLS